jgi:hypothetical protein
MLLSIQFPISSVHVLFTLRARDRENRNGAFDISISSEIDVYPLLLFKIKAIPVQARTGPEGSRSLRFPDFKTVSPIHRPPLPPKEIFLVLISVRD